MQFIYTLGSAAVCIFIAVVLYDWSRYWWYARVNGYVHKNLSWNEATGHRWQNAYTGYKLFSWLIRIAAWLLVLRYLAKAAIYIFVSFDYFVELTV